jgi:hypothetical protein
VRSDRAGWLKPNLVCLLEWAVEHNLRKYVETAFTAYPNILSNDVICRALHIALYNSNWPMVELLFQKINALNTPELADFVAEIYSTCFFSIAGPYQVDANKEHRNRRSRRKPSLIALTNGVQKLEALGFDFAKVDLSKGSILGDLSVDELKLFLKKGIME